MRRDNGKAALIRFLHGALLVVVQFRLLHNPASFLNLQHRYLQHLYSHEQTLQFPWITSQEELSLMLVYNPYLF